jgi:hypothetical protein
MGRSSHTGTSALILQALSELGDMTVLETARHLRINRDSAAALLQNLRTPSPRFPEKRVHICGYTYDDEEGRHYPRPIYRLGPGDDAKKPKAKTEKQKVTKYREARRARNRSSFVFNLASGYRAPKHTVT